MPNKKKRFTGSYTDCATIKVRISIKQEIINWILIKEATFNCNLCTVITEASFDSLVSLGSCSGNCGVR